jgi:hypothetical protein
LVLDRDSGEPSEGVLVEAVGEGDEYSDERGHADFTNEQQYAFGLIQKFIVDYEEGGVHWEGEAVGSGPGMLPLYVTETYPE